MKHNMGDTFVRAVADMYEENFYVPRIDRNMLGDPIQKQKNVQRRELQAWLDVNEHTVPHQTSRARQLCTCRNSTRVQSLGRSIRLSTQA